MVQSIRVHWRFIQILLVSSAVATTNECHNAQVWLDCGARSISQHNMAKPVLNPLSYIV